MSGTERIEAVIDQIDAKMGKAFGLRYALAGVPPSIGLILAEQGRGRCHYLFEEVSVPISGRPAGSAVLEIQTERLQLRARTPDDAEALFPSMCNPGLMRWWSRSPFTSIAELRENFATDETGTWRAWAIVRAGDSRAIGFVAAGEKRQGGVSELGYLLAPEAQGQGLAGEAVSGLVNRLFAEGQRRVFADIDPENRGSIALVERLGFKLEGRLRGEWQTQIGIRDSLIYGLLRDEWPTRRD